MLNFRKVTFKNILSSGNKATTINFTNGETTMIVGTNGTGKSLIYEAIFFCIYGKPFRKIKKGQLVNSINQKKLLVSVEMEIGGKIVTVVRGIKPNVFDIFVDGEKVKSEASTRDQQSYLTQHLLKISESTFRQIVILGSTSYVPFMTLATPARNKVINDLLDLEIYQLMLVIARKQYNIYKKELEAITTEVTQIMSRIEQKKVQISELSKSIEEESKNLDSDLSKNKEILKGFEKDLQNLTLELANIDIDVIQSNKDDNKEKLSNVERVLYDNENRFNTCSNEVHFYDNNDTCPTCKGDIDEDLRTEKLNEYRLEIEVIEKSDKEHNSTAEALNQDRTVILGQVNEFNELKDRIRIINGKLDNQKLICEKHLEVVESHKSGSNMVALNSLQDEAEELNENLKISKQNGRKSLIDNKNYENAVELLKDTGLKAQIISSYLPIINSLIQKYLDILEFPVSFTFDSEFNEIIKSRGRDELSYDNFSAGERMRLDLCLLFTWRTLASSKNSAQCNLLVLDEIGDSSLDDAGLRGFNKILKADRKKQATVIISHNSENLSGIDRIITVEKVGNFSKYNIGEK